MVEQRLKRDPHELLALRALQDVSKGNAQALVCRQHEAAAKAAPDDADLQYLAIRCLPDSPEQGRAFVSAHEQTPQHGWLAWAAAQEHAQQARWKQAYASMKVAYSSVPGLADDGRWLKPEAREQLHSWVSQRPRIQALVEHRARLAALLEARTHDASERLKQLQAWCHEAEASGIRALQEYSARLKGYALAAH